VAELQLPVGPVDFILPAGVAWTQRQPYRQVAERMRPGDPVRLRREPNNQHDPHAVLVLTGNNEVAGYLYATEAAWLSLLLDLAPPGRDESIVLGTKQKRLQIEIRLNLKEAWPIFTIVAIFCLSRLNFSVELNLAGNPFLRPLAELNSQFLADYDNFELPRVIINAFNRLRERENSIKSKS
jgi:hypothetical protein